LFKGTTVDRGIDDELRFHLERQIESYREAGLDEAEATRRARLEFGGLDQIKEEYRDALGVRILDDIWRDLRLAVRWLAATPLVSVVAGLSLALGIGADTAIFSIVDALVLRSLPVSAPERLALVSTASAQTFRPRFSYATFYQIRRHGELFDGVVAYACCAKGSITVDGESYTVTEQVASGDFFTTLGVRALIGRMLTPADDVPGVVRTGALSSSVTRFGGDSAARRTSSESRSRAERPLSQSWA
jgi:hypothetical protein